MMPIWAQVCKGVFTANHLARLNISNPIIDGVP